MNDSFGSAEGYTGDGKNNLFNEIQPINSDAW